MLLQKIYIKFVSHLNCKEGISNINSNQIITVIIIIIQLYYTYNAMTYESDNKYNQFN